MEKILWKKIFYILPMAVLIGGIAMAAGDPDIQVDIYKPDKAYSGNTLLPEKHNPRRPRVIEVNMQGEIVWEYVLTSDMRDYLNPGYDAELLPNNNILIVLPLKGIYEIDRKGKIVWSYLTRKVSHDADRLPNGNTIFAFGGDDDSDDMQVTEIDAKGKIVWSWRAKDQFFKESFKGIYEEGWTHTNAVSRLENGNTLISLRNFNFVVEVDPQGAVVRKIGEGILRHQHDPEVLPGGNILVADHSRLQRAIEIDSGTGNIVWEFIVRDPQNWPVRDVNRLPNGNTLITGTTKIIEVTPEGEVVWRLVLKNANFDRREAAAGFGFYKAERIKPE